MPVVHQHTYMDKQTGIHAAYTTNFIHLVAVLVIDRLHSVRGLVFFRTDPLSCSSLVTGVGDPHIDTIDSGRYTCHIQGVFILARTTATAEQTAQNNINNNATGSNLLYPADIFAIHVRSDALAPALFYVESERGLGSVFSSYTIYATSFTFIIANSQGKFSTEFF